MTYNGNNYTEIGWKNLWNMREAFDCDHVVVSPSVKTIKKLNKAAFIAMGDMNWHAHVGILQLHPGLQFNKIPLSLGRVAMRIYVDFQCQISLK